MFPSKNLCQLVQPAAPGTPGIDGLTAVALIAGIMVAHKSGTNPQDDKTLVVAAGQEGFFLDNDVVSVADWEAHMHGPDGPHDNTLATPVPVGKTAHARPWVRIEVEGSDHVDTDNLDADVTDKTPLKLVAGRWTPVAADGDFYSGILERKITPKVAANTTRFVIRNSTGIYKASA
jgi:hypothetical protein